VYAADDVVTIDKSLALYAWVTLDKMPGAEVSESAGPLEGMFSVDSVVPTLETAAVCGAEVAAASEYATGP